VGFTTGQCGGGEVTFHFFPVEKKGRGEVSVFVEGRVHRRLPLTFPREVREREGSLKDCFSSPLYEEERGGVGTFSPFLCT